MNIGIDIDGCINRLYLDYYHYIFKNYGIKININEYNNSPLLKKKLGANTYLKLEQGFNSSNVRREILSAYIINKLYENHNIYIITARPKQMKQKTIEWLNKNNIIYDKIYFEAGNKVDVCKSLNINYMIEDCPFNIYNLIKNDINVIVFDRPYNQEFYNGKKIHISNNWMDIYNYIKKAGI